MTESQLGCFSMFPSLKTRARFQFVNREFRLVLDAELFIADSNTNNKNLLF